MKAIFYDWGGLNVWLFHVVNGARSEWLDQLMLLGTKLGSHTNFAVYIALTAFIGVAMASRNPARQPEQVMRWLVVVAVFSVAYVADGALLGWLKPLLDFPRPPLALPPGTVNVIGAPEYHHSLPSGHSSFAMLVAASLWPVFTRAWRAAACAFVLWVGLSRISLGAHFPADVLAGFVSALTVVLLVRQLILFSARFAARIS